MAVNVLPYAVEIAGEVIRFVLKEHERNKIVDAPSYRIIQADLGLANGGCPYCAIARSLSAASLYMQRAGVRPAFASVYRELAGTQIDTAITTIGDEPDSLPNAELAKNLREYQAMLAEGVGAPSPELAARMLTAAHTALGLAEKRHDALPAGSES